MAAIQECALRARPALWLSLGSWLPTGTPAPDSGAPVPVPLPAKAPRNAPGHWPHAASSTVTLWRISARCELPSVPPGHWKQIKRSQLPIVTKQNHRVKTEYSNIHHTFTEIQQEQVQEHLGRAPTLFTLPINPSLGNLIPKLLLKFSNLLQKN